MKSPNSLGDFAAPDGRAVDAPTGDAGSDRPQSGEGTDGEASGRATDANRITGGRLHALPLLAVIAGWGRAGVALRRGNEGQSIRVRAITPNSIRAITQKRIGEIAMSVGGSERILLTGLLSVRIPLW